MAFVSLHVLPRMVAPACVQQCPLVGLIATVIRCVATVSADVTPITHELRLMYDLSNFHTFYSFARFPSTSAIAPSLTTISPCKGVLVFSILGTLDRSV